MVFRIEPGDCIAPALTPSTSASSSFTSSDDDVEGGYSSQEDNSKEILSEIIPTRTGRTARRRPQWSEPSVDDGKHARKQRLTPNTPASAPAKFPRWSAMSTSNNGDLPKSIQFYPSGERQRNSPSTERYRLLALLAIIATLAAVCLQQRSQLSSLRDELQISNLHREHVERTRSNILTQLANREQSLEQYRHTHDQMQKVNRDTGESLMKLRAEYDLSVKELERLQAVERRVKLSEGRWDTYVERVRDASKESVVEKFGEGPHRVELQVQLPSSPSPETVEIELAPLDMMPHSVHTFLEQIDQGAWDGAAFDAHAGHVLMARDSDVSKDDHIKAPPPTILFPEFNAQYPHDKYTVAFPGRPSSTPNFYVNLQPNTVHHSPRIDGEEYVEGEPCFGKIVDRASRGVVDRMDRLKVGEGGLLKESVVIKSARIVGR